MTGIEIDLACPGLFEKALGRGLFLVIVEAVSKYPAIRSVSAAWPWEG
jgi:hypothetical protein